MRYRFIQPKKASYPVEVLCRVLTVTRSGNCAWGRRPIGQRAHRGNRKGTERLFYGRDDRYDTAKNGGWDTEARFIEGKPRAHFH